MYLQPHDYWIFYVNIDLRHRYGISVAESQTFFRAKRPQRRRARRSGCFCRLRVHQGNMKWGEKEERSRKYRGLFPPHMRMRPQNFFLRPGFLSQIQVHILMSCFVFCPQSTLIFNLFDVSPNLWYSQCLPCRHVAIMDTPKMQMAATEV